MPPGSPADRSTSRCPAHDTVERVQERQGRRQPKRRLSRISSLRLRWLLYRFERCLRLLQIAPNCQSRRPFKLEAIRTLDGVMAMNARTLAACNRSNSSSATDDNHARAKALLETFAPDSALLVHIPRSWSN